jgi:hypothetical protein
MHRITAAITEIGCLLKRRGRRSSVGALHSPWMQRGFFVSYETVRRWGRKFGTANANRLRCKKPSATGVLGGSVRKFVIQSFLLISSMSCTAAHAQSYGIETDRTTAEKHGLFEVRERAREFVAKWNGREGTTWEAMDPNLKIMVPRCAVPLRAIWAPKSYKLSRPNVLVYCVRTVDGPWQSETKTGRLKSRHCKNPEF